MKSPSLTHRERDLLTALLQGDARLGFKQGNNWRVWTKIGARKVGTKSVTKLGALGYVSTDDGRLSLTTEGLQLLKQEPPRP